MLGIWSLNISAAHVSSASFFFLLRVSLGSSMRLRVHVGAYVCVCVCFQPTVYSLLLEQPGARCCVHPVIQEHSNQFPKLHRWSKQSMPSCAKDAIPRAARLGTQRLRVQVISLGQRSTRLAPV